MEQHIWQLSQVALSNSISGIKMNSNENDAMEWNDVLSEMNILIWYMHESELRMQSYGARKKGTWI